MISAGFELAAGSVTGKEHHRQRGNCQDAFHVSGAGDVLVTVVCDGCSSGRHSEVGAQLGARYIANHIASALNAPAGATIAEALEGAHGDLLAYLFDLAKPLGCSLVDAVHDYFLFTVVGMVMTATDTCFFSAGDGLFAVNGELQELGPFPGNAPPYPAYALCDSPFSKEELAFTIHCVLPTSTVDSFAIGSDGVVDLCAQESGALPGTSTVIGPLSNFWQDDLYFRNPAALGNRLRAINNDVARIDWINHKQVRHWGRLRDDTTLIVGRRLHIPVCEVTTHQEHDCEDGGA